MARSLRETLGLRKVNTPPKPPARPEPAKPPETAPPTTNGTPPTKKEEKPEKVRIEYACGHRTSITRADNCPSCQNKDRQEKNRRKRTDKGRLPDGATFHVVYDAETQTWAGTLTVGVETFEAKTSAVFHLLGILDTKFREASKT